MGEIRVEQRSVKAFLSKGVLKKLFSSSLRATEGSAAISYVKSANGLRLPRRPPRRTPHNDGFRGFSTSPFVRVSLLDGKRVTLSNLFGMDDYKGHS